MYTKRDLPYKAPHNRWLGSFSCMSSIVQQHFWDVPAELKHTWTHFVKLKNFTLLSQSLSLSLNTHWVLLPRTVQQNYVYQVCFKES